MKSLLLLLVALLLPAASHGAAAITCHCFTERHFDPARPTIADPYFLATAQNSFFAAAFAVDKKSIVMKKQQGLSAEDLWIAYALAARSARAPETLLQERKTRGSWQPVAAPLKISAGRFADALRMNAGDEQLAAGVVEDLLLRYRFYGEADLAAMRRLGAGNKELILAALLSVRSKQPAARLFLEVKNGSAGWGALLQRVKINSAAEIQAEIDRMMGRVQ